MDSNIDAHLKEYHNALDDINQQRNYVYKMLHLREDLLSNYPVDNDFGSQMVVEIEFALLKLDRLTRQEIALEDKFKMRDRTIDGMLIVADNATKSRAKETIALYLEDRKKKYDKAWLEQMLSICGEESSLPKIEFDKKVILQTLRHTINTNKEEIKNDM